MSSGSYRKADVRCPFYLHDDWAKKRITCEGILDGSSLALLYRRREDYETQLDVFCCDHYENCEVYRMLMETKYEGYGKERC